MADKPSKSDNDPRPIEGPLYPERGADAYDPDKTRQVSEVPEGLTVAETEDWVGGDAERAKAALAAEEKRGDGARTSLVSNLKRLAEGNTGAGVGSGEA